jgi:hypothetical protein
MALFRHSCIPAMLGLVELDQQLRGARSAGENPPAAAPRQINTRRERRGRISAAYFIRCSVWTPAHGRTVSHIAE